MNVFLNTQQDRAAFSAAAWVNKFPLTLCVDYQDLISDQTELSKLKRMTDQGKLVLVILNGQCIGAAMPLAMFLDHQTLADKSGFLSFEYPVHLIPKNTLSTAQKDIVSALTKNHRPEYGIISRPKNILIQNASGSPNIALVNVKYLNRYLESNSESTCLFSDALRTDFERGYSPVKPEIAALFTQAAEQAPAPIFEASAMRMIYHRASWPGIDDLRRILNANACAYSRRDRSDWFARPAALKPTHQTAHEIGQANQPAALDALSV